MSTAVPTPGSGRAPGALHFDRRKLLVSLRLPQEDRRKFQRSRQALICGRDN
jgi:hypothetical protein